MCLYIYFDKKQNFIYNKKTMQHTNRGSEILKDHEQTK